MFKGLRSLIFKVTDLAKAKAWYQEVLGYKPYFDEPFYVGFSVGGYELGLHPSGEGASQGDSVECYWAVANLESDFNRLIGLGATEATPIQDVGGGIRLATLRDPFGNLFGIIDNPHFEIME